MLKTSTKSVVQSMIYKQAFRYDANIGVQFTLQKQGKLCCTSEASKLELQKIVSDNIKGYWLHWILSVGFHFLHLLHFPT